MKVEGTYKVMKNGQAVGTVTVTREWMYYHVSCRCEISDDGMFRLIVRFADDQMDLGILVPCGRQFGLQTRMSVKAWGQGSPKFFILPRRESLQSKLVRICPEEPFCYLSRLENAYFLRKNNAVFIGFRDEK